MPGSPCSLDVDVDLDFDFDFDFDQVHDHAPSRLCF
jgi:hypothetical protein